MSESTVSTNVKTATNNRTSVKYNRITVFAFGEDGGNKKNFMATTANNEIENEKIIETEGTLCLFRNAIDKYICLLDSQMDSFPIIFKTLAINLKTSADHFEKFLKEKSVEVVKNNDSDEITYTVPLEYGKEFERLKDEMSRSFNAYSLFPRNIIVAMVSLFDAYIADILECSYGLKPQLLNSSEKTFSFSDIIQFESIEKLKKHVVEKDVESLLRESHGKQFEILSKKFNVELTKDLPSYDDFIEITERRNLFVHTNGKVSSQYLKICKNRPFDHKDKDVQLGEVLFATSAYVEHCYNVLFEIGVKLGQVLWRKIENDIKKADQSLIDIGYDLLKSKKYELSCVILDFASKPYVKHYNKECEYVFCVNRALSYYLKGDKDSCKTIVNAVDWSGTEMKFRLAYNVLLEQYDAAKGIMNSIGKDDEMRLYYGEWPLFNNFRESQQFKDAYREIYGCDYKYVESQQTKWEDVMQEAVNMIKEYKLKQSKQ